VKGDIFKKSPPYSVTDGDAIIAAIWCVPVELREFDERKVQLAWKRVCE
jgi:hypothetical protein